MKKKVKVIRKVHKSPCYVCSKIGGIPAKRSECKCCKATGVYKENTYILVVGNFAIDMDNIS